MIRPSTIAAAQIVMIGGFGCGPIIHLANRPVIEIPREPVPVIPALPEPPEFPYDRVVGNRADRRKAARRNRR